MKRILWVTFALFLLFLALPSLISGPEAPPREAIPIESQLQTASLPQTEASVPAVSRRAAPALADGWKAVNQVLVPVLFPACDGNGVVLTGCYIFSAYSSFRLSERAG